MTKKNTITVNVIIPFQDVINVELPAGSVVADLLAHDKMPSYSFKLKRSGVEVDKDLELTDKMSLNLRKLDSEGTEVAGKKIAGAVDARQLRRIEVIDGDTDLSFEEWLAEREEDEDEDEIEEVEGTARVSVSIVKTNREDKGFTLVEDGSTVYDLIEELGYFRKWVTASVNGEKVKSLSKRLTSDDVVEIYI